MQLAKRGQYGYTSDDNVNQGGVPTRSGKALDLYNKFSSLVP